MPFPILGALGISAGVGLLNNILSQGAAERQLGLSTDAQKELFDYQWNKAGSPQAQLQNLAAGGINPVSQFGRGSADIVGGSMPSVSTQPIQFSSGVDFINALTSAAKDLADVKKTGVDTTKVEKEIEGVKLSNDMQQLQNQITKDYGIPKAAKELALAAEQVKLAQQQGDINAQDLAIKKWTEAKEKAISSAEENKRDILKMELDNTEKRLELQNKESEARSQASLAAAGASRAAAQASYTQADVNREQRRISAALADIEEQGKDSKLRALLAQYRKDGMLSAADEREALMKLEQLSDLHFARNKTVLARAIDDVAQWIKDKVSIFGTLK